MALDRYEGPGKVFFGANQLAESTSVRVSYNGNNNQVTTMKKGFAGRSRGAFTSEITVENAIPLDGLEEDFIVKCIDNADVVIVIDLAGQRYSFDGYIDSSESSQATDSPASLSFTVSAGKPRVL